LATRLPEIPLLLRQYRRLCEATERIAQPHKLTFNARTRRRSRGGTQGKSSEVRDRCLNRDSGGNHSRGCDLCGSLSWKTRTAGYHYDRASRIREGGAHGTCTFGSKVWVELEKKDALSIQKGDPMEIRGPVSYVQGSVFRRERLCRYTGWPNSKESVVAGFGLGNLGTPHTIAVPIPKALHARWADSSHCVFTPSMASSPVMEISSR